MSLNLRPIQQQSLQLQTSMALDQGLEDVHLICSEYAEKQGSREFLKEMKRLYLKNNNKNLFQDTIPADDFLRSDQEMLEQVMGYAVRVHRGVFRDSGHPYIAHVLAAGLLLTRLGLPKEIVFSAILHDAVEDASDRRLMLNELHALDPAIAGYVYSVSGIDTKDAVARDQSLVNKIEEYAQAAGNVFPKAIKCADGIANLFDVEFMKANDGRSAKERQLRFLKNAENELLPWAQQVDQADIIRIKKNKEVFSFEDYTRDAIDFKLQLIEDN